MLLSKRITVLGTGLATFAAVLIAVPASAAPAAKLSTLDVHSNATAELVTELDCSSHTLVAKVTNKTSADIQPAVTFNKQPSDSPVNVPIEPGKTAFYYHYYGGNHVWTDVEVAIPGAEPLSASPILHCNEPVSFMPDQSSTSAITGYLINNSSLVPQTVLLRVGSGDVRTEILAPGETRLVALPYTGYPEQRYVFATVATSGGFESWYGIDLEAPVLPPIGPKE